MVMFNINKCRIDVKTMRNDFKIIVFKQLTTSIKAHNDCNVTGGLYVAIHVKRRQSQSALHLIWRTEDVFFENKNQASQ
jgi:hypothetical protein